MYAINFKYVLIIVCVIILNEENHKGFGCVVPPPICPNINITFWHYTRNTQKNPHELSVSKKETIQNATFVPGEFKILIHGYLGHKDYDPNIDSRPAYFETRDLNVISVDYEPLVREPCYFQASQNVPLISNCTAQLIDALVELKAVDVSKIHVVGMSLGAHVSGGISNWLKSGKLGRITGLDPALPLFATNDLSKKLDRTDATFVDIIHTDSLGRGKLESLGHLDHYVNGGQYQKGCELFKNLTMSECSHWRAPLYFAESIRATPDRAFYGKICKSWFFFKLGLCPSTAPELIMGEYATKPSTNTLAFVETNSVSPFALGPTYANPYTAFISSFYKPMEVYTKSDHKNIKEVSMQEENIKMTQLELASNENFTLYSE